MRLYSGRIVEEQEGDPYRKREAVEDAERRARNAHAAAEDRLLLDTWRDPSGKRQVREEDPEAARLAVAQGSKISAADLVWEYVLLVHREGGRFR